ncbi:MAG: threonylcarbamoyl-AMP synthase [Candidatus Thermoplasmatota archaeon]|nr:threonylcarbamoyl-AMP synthase [Candidatus Thermoplasmatota archaeon]
MDVVDSAVKVLENNGLIVYPTDTLYGIGGNPFNEDVIKKIFTIKKRPNVPISVAVSNMDMIKKIAELNPAAVRIYEEFFPGPVTVVLLKKKNVSPLLTAGSEKIGVRIPDNKIALRIINRFGPVTCTSANIHKGKNPVDIETAKKQLDDNIQLYIDDGKCKYSKPSTVVDVSDGKIKILRKGVEWIKK